MSICERGKGQVRLALRNALLVFLSFFFALLLFEGIFRLVFSIPIGHMPFIYRINSLNFRGSEPQKKRYHNIPKIMLLGDSYAFGFGVDEADILPTVVRELFRSKLDANVDLLNFSQMGWNTTKEVEFFFKLGNDYSFDALILAFTFNDIELDPVNVYSQQALILETQFTMLHALIYNLYMLKQAFLNKSQSYENTLKNFYYNKSSIEWMRMSEAILALNAYCKKNNNIFAILYFETFCAQDDTSLRYIAKQEMEAFTRQHGILFLTLPALDKCDLTPYRLHCFDAHPSRLTHYIAGETLYSLLKEKLHND